jgi:hypothetical protein
MSFCTKSRTSTLKWALSYDTPEIAHIARREVAYREIGALIDSIQLPPRDAFISTPTSPLAESYYSTLLHERRIMPISGLCRVGVIFHGFDGMDAPCSPASRCHMVVVV